MLLRFGKRENVTFSPLVGNLRRNEKIYHTKLCKRLCGQICAKLRTSLVSAENSVLIAPAVFPIFEKNLLWYRKAEFSAVNWQRNFAPRKGRSQIGLSEKQTSPILGRCVQFWGRSIRRRELKKLLDKNVQNLQAAVKRRKSARCR